AGRVIGLGGDLLDHLRAHVLELVGELDLLGDGDAVLGDAGGAERLVEDDVAALGAERHLDRVGERVDVAQHPVARLGRKADFLGSHLSLLLNLASFLPLAGALFSITPMTSDSFMMISSSPSSLISVPDHLPKRMRSPALTSSGWSLPSSPRLP